MAKEIDTEQCAKDRKGNEASSLSQRDSCCIWHPFTQSLTAPPPISIVSGKGAFLYSEEGKGYLDGIASWWVNLHGHAHPHIVQKIASQAGQLEHVIFAGYTHPQAVILAERLLALFSSKYSHVFYSDNGSTAVEVALKMAFQVQGKKLLTFEGGYHGDTFGAMSAAGKSPYNHHFHSYLFPVCSIPPPTPGNEVKSWQAFEKALETQELSAFIFEPLIQGAGGMVLHSKEVLEKMIERCQKKGMMTIGDEVMTGFGRTGPLFVSERLRVLPDVICLSKGLTGGFLPLGATIVKEWVFNAFLSLDPKDAFLHGHSYTANPIACAAANGSLDLLLKEECKESRKMIEQEHLVFQKKWKNHSQLVRCDVLGTILILEYRVKKEEHFLFKTQLIDFFHSQGILLRPLGNVLYVLPPYCISSEELKKIYIAIELTLEHSK